MQGPEESESQCSEGTGEWLGTQVGLAENIKDVIDYRLCKLCVCEYFGS